MKKFFLDLSHNNPISDLKALKETGVFGVILKDSEGTTFHDPKYDLRVKEFQAAGIPILAEYAFYHPADDPNLQADNNINKAQGIKTVVVDLEWGENPDEWKQPEEQLHGNLKTFLARFEALQFDIIIYTSAEFIKEFLPNAEFLAKYDLWIAWYKGGNPTLPPMWSTYWACQYTDAGHLAGIPGPVDLSYLNENA